MYLQSVNPVYSAAYWQAVANLMTGLAAYFVGDLEGAYLGLFVDNVNPITPGDEGASIVEASFPGYAGVNIAVSQPVVNFPNGSGAGVLGSAAYICTSDPTPAQSILGYFLIGSVTGQLLCSEYFPAPVQIVDAGDFVYLDVIFGWPAGAPQQ